MVTLFGGEMQMYVNDLKKFPIDLPSDACRCGGDEPWKRVHRAEIRSMLQENRIPVLENQSGEHVEAMA